MRDEWRPKQVPTRLRGGRPDTTVSQLSGMGRYSTLFTLLLESRPMGEWALPIDLGDGSTVAAIVEAGGQLRALAGPSSIREAVEAQQLRDRHQLIVASGTSGAR